MLEIQSTDQEIMHYAEQHRLLMLICNRDDFLTIAASGINPGLIILIRRRTRQSECAHLLALLGRAGEDGLSGNINFA